MKKSEQLQKELETEDNDLRALGLSTKVLREQRLERFEDEYLEKITSSPKVINYRVNTEGFTFWLNNGNILDYYPKANKVLIRRTNKWIKPGLQYLIKTLEL
jgi:hypothetical protein